MTQRRLRETASVGLLAVLLFIPSVVQAGPQAAGVENGAKQISTAGLSAAAGTIGSSVLKALSTAPSPQQTGADRQLWAQSLAQARARHRRSTWFLVGGASVVGLGVLYQGRDNRTGYTYVSPVGTRMATTLYLLGGGLGVYGFLERTRSQREIDDLQAEGRRRGFSASVTPAGLRASYTFSF
jgi:hypothetical protein